MLHNFRNSLRHEREQAAKADIFYRDVLKISEIKRFNTDSDTDMEMQRQDVDVLFKLNGITFRVSEKFRDKDFGDLYIEVYSKYPHIHGWLHTGSPNAILYFTPQNVYWITHKSLKEFCLNQLLPAIPENWYDDLYKSHQTIESKKLIVNNKVIHLNLIQSHNQDGAAWETIGVSLPFEVLEKFGVKYKKFSLH